MDRRFFWFIPWVAAAVCFMAGYAIAGQWIGLPFILGWLVLSWFSQKTSASQILSLLLSTGVCIAGMGALLHAPFLLMLLGSVAALAGWDLVLFQHPLGMTMQRRLTARHLQSLALALGLGFVTAGVTSVARLQMPFGILVLIVVLSFLILDRVMKALKSQRED